ncbi:MFS general substrate transporter [Xylariaceae sp. FL0255]|nr:MFS general substrate transporter [Xylariaceae sp. FL0255]
MCVAEGAWEEMDVTDRAKPRVRHSQACSITLILSAFENSFLVTAAPYILKKFPLGYNWIWVTNAFFLSSAAFQPFIGQLCDIFGRRWVTLSIVAIFIFGSGLCGGTTSGDMLIAGRAIQGVGSGGIIMAYDIIVSDLVPLRQRGDYVAIILLIYSIGTTFSLSSRWAFYINLPLGGVCLIALCLFLHVDYPRKSWSSRLGHIDIIGNAIMIAGTTAILWALTYAGTRFPWASWHTLVPLLLGFAAFFLYAAFERSKWASLTPVIPARLFAGRTSRVLPVYSQSVQLASPIRAGVGLIPLSLFGIPSAAAAVLTRMGRYKMIHILGFTLFLIGRGLRVVAFQLIPGVGAGMLVNTILPAVQAPTDETDQATATATWNFLRTIGSVWVVAIPATIFSHRLDELIDHGAISDPVAASAMSKRGAYQCASAQFVRQFSASVQEEIRQVYRLATRVALILTLFEKDIPLRKILETEYGMKNSERVIKDKQHPQACSDEEDKSRT